jgi:hypothetical protein
MCNINQNLFLESMADVHLLQNITKYCAKCYKELQLDEPVYLNEENYSYICSDCACEISQSLEQEEQNMGEEPQEVSLF